MKMSQHIFLGAALSLLAAMSRSGEAQECQLFAASGNVTKDSITILAKDRDLYWREEQRIWFSPRATHSTGDSIHFRDISVPQCSLTYKFIATNSIVMDQTTGYGVNEYGLAIISHDMDSWDDDSLGVEFFWDQDYVALALARCQTVTEAVDLFEDVILPTGINAETYFLADPSGLWLMETTGRNFVAKPIADDVASARFKQYTIRTEWCDPGNRFSSEILENAAAHGCDTSSLDFAECFGNLPPGTTAADLLALKNRGDITVEDMRELLKDKAYEATVSACVIPVRPDNDPAFFSMMWDSRANPEYGNVFLPFWIAITDGALPEHYTSWPLNDPACAWNKFTKIVKNPIYRAAAEPIWQALQAGLDAEFDAVEATMQTCLDSNDLSGLQAYIDGYVFDELDSAYNLALYIINNAGVPIPVSGLTATLVDTSLLLQWSQVTADCIGNPLVVDEYYIYRDSLSFTKPGIEPFDMTDTLFYEDTTSAVGDIGKHHVYWVTAVASGKQSLPSSRVAEFDRELMTTE